MNKYIITKQSKFIIYGAGYIGRKVFSFLQKSEFNISYFIDKNAKHIKISENIPVLSLEEIEKVKDLQKYVVIISTSNVFNHVDIVKILMRYGFRYFIFKPDESVEKESGTIIDKIYQKLIYSEKLINMELPEIISSSFIISTDILKFRRLEDNAVSIQIPGNLLFTGTGDELLPKELNGLDTNILYNPITIGLYEFFENIDKWENKSNLIKEYKNYAMASQKKVNNGDYENRFQIHLQDRYAVYCKLCEKYEYNFQYFMEYPSYVVWNNSGYFNIIDGLNRIGFLKAKNKKLFPCKISLDDYKQWENAEVLQEIDNCSMSIILKEGMIVPHPVLYRYFSYENILYAEKSLEIIIKDLKSVNNDANTIKIWGNRGIYHAHFFSCMGYYVNLVSANETEKKLLYKLMHIKAYEIHLSAYDIEISFQENELNMIRSEGKKNYIIGAIDITENVLDNYLVIGSFYYRTKIISVLKSIEG